MENKEALLSGLAEVLWVEVKVPEDKTNWEVLLRSLAHALRGLARAHPHASVLLLQSAPLPTTMLCLFAGALGRLQQAGFERKRAAETLNAVFSYAISYAMMEQAALPLTQPAQSDQPPTDFERITQIMRVLPRDAPPRLAEVAYLMCVDCDLDTQCAFGLDLLLTGLRARKSHQ